MSASIIQFPPATRPQALWNPPALAESARWHRAVEYSGYCLQYLPTGDHDEGGAWLTTTDDGLQYASIARRTDDGEAEWAGDLTAEGASLWTVYPKDGAWWLECMWVRAERFATLRDALESVVATRYPD